MGIVLSHFATKEDPTLGIWVSNMCGIDKITLIRVEMLD
jgi:hypothetical protein